MDIAISIDFEAEEVTVIYDNHTTVRARKDGPIISYTNTDNLEDEDELFVKTICRHALLTYPH